MKKLLIISAIFLSLGICCMAADRGAVDRFIRKASTSRVSFSYSYSWDTGKVRLNGNGTVLVQGNAFHMEGNGLEVWCDGSTRWTVDSAAEEAIVESVGASASDYAANPALLAGNVDKAFGEPSVFDATFSGKKVTAARLLPKVESSVKELTLYFSGDSLCGAQVLSDDGTTTSFTISALKFLPAEEDMSAFRLDILSLASSYVVTDLRF